MNMQTGFGGHYCRNRMPMVWKSDVDRIEIFAGQKFSKIAVNGAIFIAISIVDFCLRLFEMVLINIADSDVLNLFFPQQVLRVIASLPAIQRMQMTFAKLATPAAMPACADIVAVDVFMMDAGQLLSHSS